MRRITEDKRRTPFLFKLCFQIFPISFLLFHGLELLDQRSQISFVSYRLDSGLCSGSRLLRRCGALALLVAATVKLVHVLLLEENRKKAEGMWENGKPKRWYYAIPVVCIWAVVMVCVAKILLG